MKTTSLRRRLSVWWLGCLCVSALLSGCAVNTLPTKWRAEAADAAPRERYDLFVFFDGTANDEASETNVHRLFQAVASEKRPTTKALYIEGVGNARNPLTGMAFGVGMEKRIREGYEFISKHYQPDDRIYIFGFSRGAHQARALAGLIAFSGLPQRKGLEGKRFRTIANRIIERTKEENETPPHDEWLAWKPGDLPPLAPAIKDDPKLGYIMQHAQVTFLGLWDTVPGSAWKHFEVCGEKTGEAGGTRYKTGSYPPISRMAHAVSMDEKRDRFRPLLLCDPIAPKHTRTYEKLFPGAHSDVGGGYKVSERALADISLEWMLQLLKEDYAVPTAAKPATADGVAHWPVWEGLARIVYDCEDRENVLDSEVKGFAVRFNRIEKHTSIESRTSSNAARIRFGGADIPVKYPLSCKEAEQVLR